MKRLVKVFSIILAIVLLGGLGGIVADHYVFPHLSSTSFFSKYDFFKNFTEDVTVINKTEQVFVKEETSISKISNQVSASVVNIISYPNPSTVLVAKKNAPVNMTTNGTGVIITSDGLILTVLTGSSPENSKYKVMLADGNNFDAEYLGTDSYSRLSFLKIDASNLAAISFGNSDDTKPGEKLIAIGNGFGFYSYRYAAGLLSSNDLTYNLGGYALSFSDRLEGVFETDFNFEKNYVGGPIVDYAGQTVGLVSSLEKNGNEEFFQIPANKVKKVIERAIQKEFDKNPSLGIYYVPITKTYALSNDLDVEKGALIFSPSGQPGLAMIAGSTGQKAGLQINDIITALNGQEINLENNLPDLLYQYKQGDKIELTVLRNNQELKVSVNL